MNNGINLDELRRTIAALESKVDNLTMKVEELEIKIITEDDLPWLHPHQNSKNGRKIRNRILDDFLNEE